MYLTLVQTANELDRTERQVRYLVKTGLLSPANQDTYKRDGGYRFSKEVVDQIKEKLKPEGISLRKAAEIIGITPQYLNSLALKDEIASELVLIGNKTERRFKEQDCIDFKHKYQNKTHKSVAQFGEKLHLYNRSLRLFELIDYKGEPHRIVRTVPITFLKTDGSIVQPTSNDVFPQTKQWPDKPYKTKKGFITFQVPIPRNAEHTTYNALYTLIEELGPKNVQVFEQKDGDYLVRCRQGKVSLTKDYSDLLKRYVIEGEIHHINDVEIMLESSVISQYIHIPRNLHVEIEKLADERTTSINQQLIEIIVRGLNSFYKEK